MRERLKRERVKLKLLTECNWIKDYHKIKKLKIENGWEERNPKPFVFGTKSIKSPFMRAPRTNKTISESSFSHILFLR